MPDLPRVLLENLEAFTAFARSRLGDGELARDAVQESLLKAVTAEHRPTESDAVRWFYRILRRTIIDLYRRKDVRERGLSRYEADLEATADAEETRLLCACFERLLPELPEQYRDLIERVDLAGASPTALAAERGVTANALTVQLHRARRRLRELLEATCRVCATHGCLDCTCGSRDGHS
jgi:RNA polymerase sigma-70 factor (ECF subfamily)